MVSYGDDEKHETLIALAPALLPIISLDILERQFWDRTRSENREIEFITDGAVYTVTAVGNYSGVNNGLTKIEEFIRLTECNEALLYHTHPHLDEDGTKEICHISPPSFSDFFSFALLNDGLPKPRIKTRVIEKYGIWEYSAKTLLRCNPSDLYFYNQPTAMKIREIKDLSIDEQVEAMIDFYNEDSNQTTSFRKF